VDDLRDFLFSDPTETSKCLDLVSLNIQRARDHGLHRYNRLRVAAGLSKKYSFDQITSNKKLQAKLQTAYKSVDKIDGWIGAVSEDHLKGSGVGELHATVIRDQFERLMVGDPFFFLNDTDLSKPKLNKIIDLKKLTLAQVIQWNTIHKNLDPNTNVFYV
jgi:peroxidase